MAAATSSAFSHEELIADKVTFQRRRLTPIDESTRDVSTRHVVSLVTCLEAPKNEILKFWRQQREPKTQPAGTAPRGSHVARAQRDDLLLRDLVAPLALSFRSRLPPPRARARWRRAPSPSGSGYTT